MEGSAVETEARRKEQKKDDLGREILYPKPNITRKLNGKWGFHCEKEGCGRVLSSKKMFNLHMANHMEETNGHDVQEDNVEDQELVVPPIPKKKPSSHSCSFCSKSFWTNSDLEYHIRIHVNEKQFGCPYLNCEKMFTSHKGVQNHQPSHSKEKPHKCSKCELSLNILKTLNKYKKRKHPKNNSFPQHACQLCPAVSCQKLNLEYHLETHMDPLSRPSFQCPECEISFTTNNNMKRHMKCYHNIDKPLTIKCSYCRHNFFSEDDLREHKQNEGHNREKQFGCAICDVEFALQKTLTKHLKTERHRMTEEAHKLAKNLLENCVEVQQAFAEKKWVLVPKICCKSCKSTFPSEQELAQHVNNIHNLFPDEVERPFCCKVKGCDKAFTRKENVKNHVNAVHLNLRNYSCSRCGETFKYGKQLKQHNGRNPDCDVVIRDEQSKHRKDESKSEK